jgi:pimeloyl-ACP methyl ester carboxylesterase
MSHSSFTTEFLAEDRKRAARLRRDTIDGMARTSRSLWRRMLHVLAALVIGYFLLAVPLAWYQVRLIYWNEVTPIADLTLPSGWRIRDYVSQDRRIQYAAYVHEGGRGAPTVVYLHGRGESFRIIGYNVQAYIDKGWTVVAPEYPGFAGLSGEPSERIIRGFMGKVYDDLMERGVDPRKLLIHGNSLGGGPALQLAQYPHAFLLLSAPVGDMARLVGRYVPFYPTVLLRDRWDNGASAATRYRAPAQVVHASDDMVVPVDQGRTLAARAHARFTEVPTGGHAIAGLDRGIRFENGKFRYE